MWRSWIWQIVDELMWFPFFLRSLRISSNNLFSLWIWWLSNVSSTLYQNQIKLGKFITCKYFKKTYIRSQLYVDRIYDIFRECLMDNIPQRATEFQYFCAFMTLIYAVFFILKWIFDIYFIFYSLIYLFYILLFLYNFRYI